MMVLVYTYSFKVYTRVYWPAEGLSLSILSFCFHANVRSAQGALVWTTRGQLYTIHYLGFVFMQCMGSLQVPLAGKRGLGISFHTGELSSASPCCSPCTPLLGCPCPCSCCPPDNMLAIFTPVREVISEMDSSVNDCWVAVGTFTGQGVGLLWGDCSCGEKDACSCIRIPVLSCSLHLSLALPLGHSQISSRSRGRGYFVPTMNSYMYM